MPILHLSGDVDLRNLMSFTVSMMVKLIDRKLRSVTKFFLEIDYR